MITHATMNKSLEHVTLMVDLCDEEIQKCAALCLENLRSYKDIVLKLQEGIQPLVNLPVTAVDNDACVGVAIC